jgi:hypothetical protein
MSNCPVKKVTENTIDCPIQIEIFPGYLVITVTENGAILWSLNISKEDQLNQDGKDAVFEQLAVKYNWLPTKKEKSDFLLEIEQIILPRLSIEPMHRKSLIRKLRKMLVRDVLPAGRRGRAPKYHDIHKQHLVQIWRLSGYPCSKRLKELLPDWLEHYQCSEKIKSELCQISASQMDEYLRHVRIDHQRKVNSGTIPAKNHIKKLIRLRDPSQRNYEPGAVESDTVLHCGTYIWGTYAHTVSATDLATGWTLGEAVFGKNAALVVQALKKRLSIDLPCPLTALYFDNGIEYVNHLLVEEFKVQQGVDVARGRAGKSNDQCHIEQKNNTFVRQLFGHVRIEDPNLIPLMNDIYETWGLLHNYFMPQAKLISKDRVGAKVRKKYDKPKTPYQRMLESPSVSEEVKEQLRQTKAKLNPFELQAELQKKLAYFHARNDEYNAKVGDRKA